MVKSSLLVILAVGLSPTQSYGSGNQSDRAAVAVSGRLSLQPRAHLGTAGVVPRINAQSIRTLSPAASLGLIPDERSYFGSLGAGCNQNFNANKVVLPRPYEGGVGRPAANAGLRFGRHVFWNCPETHYSNGTFQFEAYGSQGGEEKVTLSVNGDERDLNLRSFFPQNDRKISPLFSGAKFYIGNSPDGRGKIAKAAVVKYHLDHNVYPTHVYQTIPSGQFVMKIGATPEETCVVGAVNFSIPSETEMVQRSRDRITAPYSESNWRLLTSRQKKVVEEGIQRGQRRVEQLLAMVENGQLDCHSIDAQVIKNEVFASPFNY